MKKRQFSRTFLLLACFCLPLGVTSASQADTAIFAGGCFWCMEQAYQELDGVQSVVSGFSGGTLNNPSYRGNHEGHYEAIEVTYNPEQISYQQLLDNYWVNIDPFDDRGQFCDKGPSYRAAIFVATDAERSQAEASLARVQQQFPNQNVVTQILPSNKFWPVEEGHQDYYKKNPLRYKFYKSN